MIDIKEIHLSEHDLDGQSRESNSNFVNLDFKVVSFNIGEDNYLIDIMKVKEIRKSSNFTYVPNSRSYVVGLDNLRGEIISIIDLRIMFDLEISEKELEDVMVLRNEDLLIGIIVDKVNNVFSIDSSLIQDPHPVLSQDSFISYIKGVIEYGGKLYILLDVDTIFNYDEGDSRLLENKGNVLDISGDGNNFINSSLDEVAGDSVNGETDTSGIFLDDLKIIKENLFQYSFNASLIKDEFLRKVGINLNIININDLSYERFLTEFYSKSSGCLWSDEYLKEFQDEIIKKHVNNMSDTSSVLNVFEIGCGNGKETISFVNALYEGYNKPFKVTAIDNDLIRVIGTSGLVFSDSDIKLSEIYKKNSFQQSSGVYKFKPEIMNNILFEYSDAILSEFPENLGIVFLRDVLCFLNDDDQALILDAIAKKTVGGALLILGDNEELKNNDIFVKDRSVEHFNLYKRI